jgi:hypothetical protein
MSHDTSEEWSEITGEPLRGITQIDVEDLYLREGIKLESVCELKSVWYVNHPTPRAYYTTGGKAYHASKYMHIMVDLAEKLDCTRRVYCTQPGRLVIKNHATIYDLTSFTSLLRVHAIFLEELGKYCRGHSVTILDSHRGELDADLGLLISEYVEGCYSQPEFDVRLFHESIRASHLVAGMLGVFGNIDSAKFLHGGVMLQRVDATNQLNVAGDDGIVDDSDEDETVKVLSKLGKIATEKMFVTYDPGCIHLKRPIEQLGSSLIHQRFAMWPPFEYAVDVELRDPRHPQLMPLLKNECRSAAASSALNFLRQLPKTRDWHDVQELIRAVMSFYYKTFNLRLEGSVPQFGGPDIGLVPRLLDNYIGQDPVRFTCDAHFRGKARFQVSFQQSWTREMLDMPVFECNPTPLLSYLVRLGYLRSQKVIEELFGELAYDRVVNSFKRKGVKNRVVAYSLLRPVPQWLVNELIVDASDNL